MPGCTTRCTSLLTFWWNFRSWWNLLSLPISSYYLLAPGTANGFKGWIKKYNSGYLAADEQLYLFFRCGADNRITRLRRVRRKRSNNPQTAPPPRPCVNDTVPAETEVGESGSGGGNTTDLICPQLFTEEPTESEEWIKRTPSTATRRSGLNFENLKKDSRLKNWTSYLSNLFLS